MEKADLEELKEKVPCAAVLEHLGFAFDRKESTRKAMKYRRAAAIIIVIHDGKGWFDPLSDGKGDVFRLVEHLEGVPFVEAMNEVACLVGFVPAENVWDRETRDRETDLSVPERWQARRKPWRGSATWRYLSDTRRLPEPVLRAAIAADILREGPHGSMWAAHGDADGAITGWEERGPDWRGFATGGGKVLFRLGRPGALRFCVTEAAIDAMSLAAFEGLRPDTLYLSTGGGWSLATYAAIRALAVRPGGQLIAATDNNKQGDVYAGRLLALAEEAGCFGERLRPMADDWNADLKAKEEARGKEGGKPTAACPPAASRVKLRPAAPALDPPGRRGGCGGGGVRKG
ncbi:DUF3991 domain-containing protein [Mesorhizobium sp. M2E.F.Ca.ET.209.01.1.1]|uniref:DUF3991 and toprim domain-containing protein n=1 Tax=Mesorhizobium sp. M2E.F.Ca.ET.209.01.1.1 TaxID=2500526 RepID=UPI000FD974F5|nr:DUF3991 and toprim domain-containing protein [Mesorhizobium sp. M2E.F.Ca.ET.209.01.1.1]TGS14215.1 DUF3991 domain-containing protein [Mesorhizobium sp. M2E.F.Ca.ET.209.01.1.1]